MQGPEDLDDDFIIDHNLTALSDDDGVLLPDFSEKSENQRKRKRGAKENERKFKVRSRPAFINLIDKCLNKSY